MEVALAPAKCVCVWGRVWVWASDGGFTSSPWSIGPSVRSNLGIAFWPSFVSCICYMLYIHFALLHLSSHCLLASSRGKFNEYQPWHACVIEPHSDCMLPTWLPYVPQASASPGTGNLLKPLSIYSRITCTNTLRLISLTLICGMCCALISRKI